MSESRIHVEGLKPTDLSLIQRVADEAAERAVKKTFVAMGLNPDNPLEAQADMVFLRSTRQRCESAQGKAMVTVIGLAVASTLGAVWIGLKTSILGH